MAYSYTQDFNSLSTADLGGQDSWVATGPSSFADVSTDASAIFEGAKGILATTGGTFGNYRRTVTSMTTGSVYYATRATTYTSSGDGLGYGHYYDNTATKYSAMVKWATSAGTLEYLKTGTWANLTTGLSTDTWYIVNQEFDASTDQVRYRWKEEGGSWSAYTSWETAYSTGTAIDLITLFADGGTYTFDTISDTEPTPGTTVNSGFFGLM